MRARGICGLCGPVAHRRASHSRRAANGNAPGNAGFCAPWLRIWLYNMARIYGKGFLNNGGARVCVVRAANASRAGLAEKRRRDEEHDKKRPRNRGLGIVAEAYRGRTYHGHLCPPPVLKTGRHTGDETLPRAFGVSSRIALARQGIGVVADRLRRSVPGMPHPPCPRRRGREGSDSREPTRYVRERAARGMPHDALVRKAGESAHARIVK